MAILDLRYRINPAIWITVFPYFVVPYVHFLGSNGMAVKQRWDVINIEAPWYMSAGILTKLVRY